MISDMKEHSFLTLRDILRTFFKNGRQILILTVLSAILGAIVSFSYPPVFESRGEILVKRLSLNEKDPGTNSDSMRVTPNIRHLDQAGEINTVIVLLKSMDLTRRIVETLDITRERFDRIPDYRKYIRRAWVNVKEVIITAYNQIKYTLHLSKPPTPEERRILEQNRLLADIADAFDISQVPDSDIISIAFRCNDQTLAREITGKMCEQALFWHEEKTGLSPVNLTFYKNQVDDARHKLNRIEKELSTLRSTMNLIGAERETALLIEHRLLSKSRLNKALVKQKALDAQLAFLKNEIRKNAPYIILTRDISINPVWENVAHEIARMKLDRFKQGQEYAEQGRIISGIDESIKESEALLETIRPEKKMSFQEGVNTIHESLAHSLNAKTAEHVAVSSEIDRIREEIEEFNQELKTINQNIHLVSRLELEWKSTRETYEMYLKTAEETRLLDQKKRAKIVDLIIIQQADSPIRPVKPRKWLYIFLSALCAFVLTTALCFVRELNDTTYWNADEIQNELGLQVLGTIEQYKG